MGEARVLRPYAFENISNAKTCPIILVFHCDLSGEFLPPQEECAIILQIFNLPQIEL